MAETTVQAERAVLGALLLGGNASTEQAKTILGTDPDVFLLKEHREIYRAIQSLIAEGNPVDPVTVTIRGGQQGASFSATYLSELTGCAPTTANAPYYARLVKRADAERKLDLMGGALACAARKGDVADAQTLARQIAELDCDCSEVRPQFALDPIPDLENLEEQDWLYQELIPMGYCSMLTSPGGLGKSRMALGLAVSTVTGQTIWPSFVPSKIGHVLYLSAEDSATTVAHRLKSYRDVHRIAPDVWGAGITSRLHVQCESGCDMVEFDPKTRTVSPTPYFYAVQSWCREVKPVLIIIDTLSDHAGGINENDNSQMKAAFKAFKMLAQVSGGSVLVIHHVSKGSADPDKTTAAANDVRGASASVNSSRSVFVARPDAEGGMTVTLVKGNLTRRCGESWKFDLSNYALRESGVAAPPLMCRTPDVLIPDIVKQVTLFPGFYRTNGADRENAKKSRLMDELSKKYNWIGVGVLRNACAIAIKSGAVSAEDQGIGKGRIVTVMVPSKGNPSPPRQERMDWEEPPYQEEEDGVPPEFDDEDVF